MSDALGGTVISGMELLHGAVTLCSAVIIYLCKRALTKLDDVEKELAEVKADVQYIKGHLGIEAH